MTKEEKQLLIIDLCMRLPYYTELYSNVADGNWAILTPVVISNLMNATDKLVIKPYLRPMSSMTEEEREEWADKFNFAMDELSSILDEKEAEDAAPYMFAKSHFTSIDWLLAHHFDYRGLIEKGLALEAPENMYKDN